MSSQFSIGFLGWVFRDLLQWHHVLDLCSSCLYRGDNGLSVQYCSHIWSHLLMRIHVTCFFHAPETLLFVAVGDVCAADVDCQRLLLHGRGIHVCRRNIRQRRYPLGIGCRIRAGTGDTLTACQEGFSHYGRFAPISGFLVRTPWKREKPRSDVQISGALGCWPTSS